MESNYIKAKLPLVKNNNSNKDYQNKNKEALIKYSRNYYKENKEKFKLYYENYKKKKSLNCCNNNNNNTKNKYIEAIEKEKIKIQKLKDKAEQYKLLLQQQGYNVNL